MPRSRVPALGHDHRKSQARSRGLADRRHAAASSADGGPQLLSQSLEKRIPPFDSGRQKGRGRHGHARHGVVLTRSSARAGRVMRPGGPCAAGGRRAEPRPSGLPARIVQDAGEQVGVAAIILAIDSTDRGDEYLHQDPAPSCRREWCSPSGGGAYAYY